MRRVPKSFLLLLLSHKKVLYAVNLAVANKLVSSVTGRKTFLNRDGMRERWGRMSIP